MPITETPLDSLQRFVLMIKVQGHPIVTTLSNSNIFFCIYFLPYVPCIVIQLTDLTIFFLYLYLYIYFAFVCISSCLVFVSREVKGQTVLIFTYWVCFRMYSNLFCLFFSWELSVRKSKAYQKSHLCVGNNIHIFIVIYFFIDICHLAIFTE